MLSKLMFPLVTFSSFVQACEKTKEKLEGQVITLFLGKYPTDIAICMQITSGGQGIYFGKVLKNQDQTDNGGDQFVPGKEISIPGDWLMMAHQSPTFVSLAFSSPARPQKPYFFEEW